MLIYIVTGLLALAFYLDSSRQDELSKLTMVQELVNPGLYDSPTGVDEGYRGESL